MPLYKYMVFKCWSHCVPSFILLFSLASDGVMVTMKVMLLPCPAKAAAAAERMRMASSPQLNPSGNKSEIDLVDIDLGWLVLTRLASWYIPLVQQPSWNQ